MLSLQKVSKSFPMREGNFEVLNDISLNVKNGEFVCILGPSGCGKSILLYLIAGFLKTSAAGITCNHQTITGPGPDRMVVFQNYVLFPWRTVYQNIALPLKHSRLSARKNTQLIDHYLELTGLTTFKDWYPYQLSGGMQQRVALARSLVVNPKILLMDEPFAALDEQYRKYLTKFLVNIWEQTKKTIIFVTHNINEAIHLADRIYLLTARPATVKNVYEVNLPRPRKKFDPNFIALHDQIDKDFSEEFFKILQNPAIEKSVEGVLKLTGRRGIL